MTVVWLVLIVLTLDLIRRWVSTVGHGCAWSNVSHCRGVHTIMHRNSGELATVTNDSEIMAVTFSDGSVERLWQDRDSQLWYVGSDVVDPVEWFSEWEYVC